MLKRYALQRGRHLLFCLHLHCREVGVTTGLLETLFQLLPVAELTRKKGGKKHVVKKK